MNIDLEKTIENLTITADWVGLRYVSEKSQTHRFRDGLPQYHGKKINRGVMAEVLVNGQMGYCATNRLDFASIQRAVNNARQQAISAQEWEFLVLIVAFVLLVGEVISLRYKTPLTLSVLGI